MYKNRILLSLNLFFILATYSSLNPLQADCECHCIGSQSTWTITKKVQDRNACVHACRETGGKYEKCI
jgi:hypothetical protein